MNMNDLQRDIGRMEGKQDAMGDRLDKLEQIVTEGFSKMDERLARIEASEAQRKGVINLVHWVAGAVGGLIVLLADHFWK